jgi:signal transduction histidine kinase
MGDRLSALDVVLPFARAAATVRTSGDILPLLADALATLPEVDAVAVLELGDDGRVRLAASSRLPETLADWSTDGDALGPELAQSLLVAAEGIFERARPIPLVSGGDLYGIAMLLSRRPATPPSESSRLAESLVDLTAVALERAARHSELVRSLEQLRASREALSRSEKLRSLGEMAAGIAHDLKNILNPIGLQLELLTRRMGKDPAAALEVVDQMRQALRSGAATVDRLRAFSRQAPERAAERTSLEEAVRSGIEICKPRLRQYPRLRVQERLDGAGTVLVRADELINAVVNLIVNAIDAMGGEGELAVRTGAAADHVWVEVEDTGAGIPEDVARRIFEPFYTTKREGTGLGLATIYAFARRHGGDVTFRTVVGEGTCFRIQLPSASGTSPVFR